VNRRAILNEDDLIHELARRGFSIVYCAELSYEQQEAVFRSATVIVSAHGGALTNMIFSAPGAIIIELFHGMQINPWYKNLANILNHRYGFIGFDLPNPMGSWYSDFTVDVPKVIDLVDAMQADSI
jgi:capsular polysaccharide biosynthesis protein